MRNSDRPVFFLQNNYYGHIGRLIDPCLDFCRSQGHEFIDRSLTADFHPDNAGIDWSMWPGVIPYGSVGWVKRCAESSIAPWVFYDAEAFSASVWAPVLSKNALNSDGFQCRLADLEAELAAGAVLHVRPDRDDKAFPGALYDIESWRQMTFTRSMEGRLALSPDLCCYASSHKTIEAEFRCWFVGDELIDISEYRRNGSKSLFRCTDVSIARNVCELSREYLPSPTVVMDVALTSEGLKVIEFNPISSSGWYASDTLSILQAWSNEVRRLSDEPYLKICRSQGFERPRS